MRCIAFTLFMLFAIRNICCAQHTIQQLTTRLNATKQDTNRVNAYYTLSYWYWNKNIDSTIIMADSSLELAKKLNFKKGIALAYLSKGVALDAKGKYPESLSCHLQALQLSEELNLEGLSANCYNNIGIVYSDMSDYKNALFNYKRSLTIMMKQTDADAASIGSLINIGETYMKLNNLDSSNYYNAKALVISRKLHDSANMAVTLYNIGDAYIIAKKYYLALPYLQQSLNICKSINDMDNMTSAYTYLAVAYYHIGQYQQSIDYAKQSLFTGKSLGIYQLTKDAYNILYLSYAKLAQYEQALYYRNAEISLADSLNTIEKNRQIKELQGTYDLEKKQQVVDRLKKEHAAQQKEIIRNKKTQTIGVVLVLMLGLLSLFLYINYAEKTNLSVQLKQRNDEMLLKHKELEEVNNTKNKILSIVGHDLRGPISSLVGILDLLNSQSLTPEEADYFLTHASSSLTSTRHLLNNLLYWAKSQMEGMVVTAKTFDLQQIIKQNLLLAKTRTKEKGIVLQQEGLLQETLVHADHMMIDLVLRNLIENAVKFSRAGDIITVITEKNGPFIKATIKDNGQGIPQENQAKLFNKLISHTTYGTAQEKGSGLGLLLCKELVEKNGGTIGFTSTPGNGSTFYFTLPATKSEVSNLHLSATENK